MYGYASMRAEFHIQCHFLCDETLKQNYKNISLLCKFVDFYTYISRNYYGLTVIAHDGYILIGIITAIIQFLIDLRAVWTP